jgi:hypothetical protein
MIIVWLLPQYLSWHYSAALTDGAKLTRNLLFAVGHVFSFGDLLTGLFSPWHRMTENASGKRFDIEDWAGRIVVNIMSRLIGAVSRMCVVMIGLATLTTGLIFVVVGYMAWIAAPVLIAGLLIRGVQQFI